ncbi:MAG TPA: glycerol kinase GlpK [Bryobacteraceae bacterium]|nr:glycerol kinase GlpK [Bryobacteraceae bacterium]
MPFILSLDEGTTSARAALYDQEARRVSLAAVPTISHFPHPGWVEQDANQIWEAQIAAVHNTLGLAGYGPEDVQAIGITNQRETTVVWDRATGQPVSPAIVWQCRRTAARCRELSAHAAKITRKSGLVVDAYFSGTKIEWILNHIPDGHARAANGDLLFGNIDTWLIWKLTGGRVHATDPTNASRTMLFNLGGGDWDEELLSLLHIPRAMLPAIVPSSSVVGHTSGDLLGVEIPIAGIAGDQQAALAGQACFSKGLSKNTYGTGCFALLHAGSKEPISENRLLATRAASATAEAQFAVEGSIFVAGAAIQWLRDKVGLLTSAPESGEIAESIDSTGGVYLVPAFVGLGAPHWDAEARAEITGLSLGTGRAEIVRAALESMAYQTRELIQAMEADSETRLAELRVDGGAAANNFLMQFQADMLDRPVVRPADPETTALGAAFLAGLATGYWKSVDEVSAFWKAERTFEPAMKESTRDALWTGWQRAVQKSRTSC